MRKQDRTFTLLGSGLLVVALLLNSGCGSEGGTDEGVSTTLNEAVAAVTRPCYKSLLCPVADAGPNQSVPVGTVVRLDGSRSINNLLELVTYEWTLTAKPAASTAVLRNPTTVRPTFTADLVGNYTAKLVVRAGREVSSPSTVVITASTGNIPPVADAGPDRTVSVRTRVTLDGTGSTDPNGTPIASYQWKVLGQPSKGQARLDDPKSATPSFFAFYEGTYNFALVVTDGSLTSAPKMVTITASTGNIAPVANAGPDQLATTGQVVTLNGSGSYDPNGDSLAYGWRFISMPTGSTAMLVNFRTVSPTFTPDLVGFYVVVLAVGDQARISPLDFIVIEARSSAFSQRAYLKASNTNADDFLGATVVLDGDTLVVGASGEDSCAVGVNGIQTNNGCNDAGAVYVFTRANGMWTQQAYLKASNTEPNDIFGTSVALSGDTLAVGARGENSCAVGANGDQANNNCLGAGAVYVFTRTNGVWTQQAYVKASNTGANAFGSSVALSGDTLAVGAVAEDSCAVGVNGDQTNNNCPVAGAVYVFTRANGMWTQQAYMKASNTDAGDAFGHTIALDGNTLAVGGQALAGPFWGEDSCAVGFNGDQANNNCPAAGAVYVFTRTNGVWMQQAYVKASNTAANDIFGTSIALSGDTLAVGTSNEASCAVGVNGDQTNNGCTAAGAVYVFTRTNGVWTQQAYVKASNTAAGDIFGTSIALSGDTLAVGASNEASCAVGVNGDQANKGCPGAGAVYVFTRANEVWTQRNYVKASNTDNTFADAFGFSVALSGDTLAVGARGEASCAVGVNGDQANNNCLEAGAVYVLERQ